jgi:hypothetical protein
MRQATIFSLVHGTFAPNAPWTRSNSPLVERLKREFPQSTFRPFLWSGDNSHRARASAAEALADFIRDGSLLSGQARHFVIAHSHGGNLALNAVKLLARSCPIDGVVTLGTPFLKGTIHAFSGSIETLRTGMLILAGALCACVSISMWFWVGGLVDPGLALTNPVLRSPLAWLLGAAFAGILFWLRSKLPRWHSVLEASAHRRLKPDENWVAPDELRLLAIRYSLDEAGVWLKVIAALANLSTKIVSWSLIFVLQTTSFLGLLPKLLGWAQLVEIPLIVLGLFGGSIIIVVVLWIGEILLAIGALIAVGFFSIIALFSIPTLFLMPWLIRGHRFAYGAEDVSTSAFISWDSKPFPDGAHVTRKAFSVLDAIRKAGLLRSLKAFAHGTTSHGLVYEHQDSIDAIVIWLHAHESEPRLMETADGKPLGKA